MQDKMLIVCDSSCVGLLIVQEITAWSQTPCCDSAQDFLYNQDKMCSHNIENCMQQTYYDYRHSEAIYEHYK